MSTIVVQTQASFPMLAIGEALLIIGVALAVIGLFLFVLGKGDTQVSNLRAGQGMTASLRAYVLIIAFILIFPGVMFVLNHPTNSSITVGQDYISITGKVFGTQNFSSSDIEAAFVGNTQTGNLTLSHKVDGLASTNGVTNEGLFKLSNGANADVITVNTTALFVKTSSGVWLVLGTSNTGALANAFSSGVCPVAGYA